MVDHLRIGQSIWARARDDFIAWTHTLWFRAAELIVLAVSGGVAATLAPAGWSGPATGWFAALVAIVSALVLALLVYLALLIAAPVQQRNEAWAELRSWQDDDVDRVIETLRSQ